MDKGELKDINIMIKEIDNLIHMCIEAYFTSITSSKLSSYRVYFKTFIFDMIKQRRNLIFLRKNYKHINKNFSLCCIVITLKDYIYEYINGKMGELDNIMTIIILSLKNISTNLQVDDNLNRLYYDSISSMMSELKSFKKCTKKG